MASFQGWHIYLVDGTGQTEITDYVLGFSTKDVVNIGSPSTVDAFVTLNNNDGRFTPADGGGTGQFKNTDWLSKSLLIQAEVDYTPAPVADSTLVSLVIADVQFRDDGVNSQMTIQAQDWLSLTSSAITDVTEAGSSIDLWLLIDGVFRSTNFDVVFPQLDRPDYDAYVFSFPGSVQTSELKTVNATAVTALDYINQAFLRAAPGIILPQGIGISDAFKRITYVLWVIDRTLNNTSFAYLIPDIEFSETASDGVMAFKEVKPGFKFTDITSRSTITSAATGVTSQTATNATTGNRYGTRTRTSSQTGNATDADALTAAQFWTQRQGAARYTPRQLETSVETIFAKDTGNATGKALWFLLSNFIMWFPCKVTYTPTGGQQVSEACVISGRTVEAVPGRTTIKLDLLPANDYQSFTLDSQLLGVLGGTLDTYDKSTYTYDEDVLYNGVPVHGFRLG